jgi:hypothetical protein
MDMVFQAVARYCWNNEKQWARSARGPILWGARAAGAPSIGECRMGFQRLEEEIPRVATSLRSVAVAIAPASLASRLGWKIGRAEAV